MELPIFLTQIYHLTYIAASGNSERFQTVDREESTPQGHLITRHPIQQMLLF